VKRVFSRRQRRLIEARAAGRCEECGEGLTPSFHADHRVPHAVGGPTTLINGRATCAPCNLSKGSKLMLTFRDWQTEAHDRAVAHYAAPDGDKHFIVNAAPGAGKTKLACVIARTLLTMGVILRVIIIAPRRKVVEQWAKEFEDVTGEPMTKVTSASRLRQPSGRFVCATWNAVVGLQDHFHAICAGGPTLVICDEHHHAAIEAAWGSAADSAFKEASHCLILTGTPVRSDGALPVWFTDEDLQGLRPDPNGTYTLSYGEAVRLGYCRPVIFHRHRGRFLLKLEDGQEVTVANDAPAVLPATYASNRVLQRAANFIDLTRKRWFDADNQTPKADSFQASMVAWASAKLDEVRLELPEAGGLVIAQDIAMATYFARIIENFEGERPTLVHSDLPGSDLEIDNFRRQTKRRWLVSIGMVAEGVDIPRLRVLIYMPKALTELVFRQAVGRVVRNFGIDDQSLAYVVMPAIEQFDCFARRIEGDMPVGSCNEKAVREKRCGECHEGNGLGASQCAHCGADFPSRAPAFTSCSCGWPNRTNEHSCLNCGVIFQQPYEVTLEEASRDGIIARGMTVTEDELADAQAKLPQTYRFLEKVDAENPELGMNLRNWDPLQIPKLIRLFKDAEESGGAAA